MTTSSSIEKEEPENAKEFIEKLGFNCRYSDSVLDNHLEFAGTPEERSREFNSAVGSDSDIIWAVRGGYGSVQVLDKVKYDRIKNKLFIGYSDFSLLLNAVNDRTGLITFHGPMPSKDFEKYHEKTIDMLKKALQFENYSWKIDEENILVSGKAEGEVVGGNLELFVRSLGTEYEYETEGKIIFLEDNKVKGKNIYDMLQQLKLAGKFEDASGIVTGKFTNAGEPIKYVKDFFKDFKIPVIYDMDFGHKEPNLTFPIGAECVVDTDNRKVKFKLGRESKPWSG